MVKKQVHYNRILYSLVVLLILSWVGFVAYAAVDTSKGYHSIDQIQPPASGCNDGEVLKRSGNDWICAVEAGGSITDTNAKTLCGDGRFLRGESTTTCRTAAQIVSDGGGDETLDCVVETCSSSLGCQVQCPSGYIAMGGAGNCPSSTCSVFSFPYNNNWWCNFGCSQSCSCYARCCRVV